MKRSILLFITLMLLSGALVLAQDVQEMRHTHYVLNVRAGPGTGYSILGKVDSCDWLQVVRQVDRWFQVRYDEGSGFVAGWYTAAGDPHCANVSAQPSIPGSGDPVTVVATETPSGDGDTGGDISTFTGNLCYTEWECGLGDNAESIYKWKTGWCMATIQQGVASWTLEECQIGIGLRPGDPTSAQPSQPSSSRDWGKDGGDGGSDGGGSCPPTLQWKGYTVTLVECNPDGESQYTDNHSCQVYLSPDGSKRGGGECI